MSRAKSNIRTIGTWSVLLVLHGILGAGCANITAGRITPAHFKFKPVVPHSSRDAEPNGWQAVCIDARFTHGNTGAKGVCKFEVGIPMQNDSQGLISLDWARDQAAREANRAAHVVMSTATPGDLAGPLCLKFKKTYEAVLRMKIAGARVGACESKGIETVVFDVSEAS